MSRRKARQSILQILYRDEFHLQFLDKKKDKSLKEFFLKKLNEKDSEFALEIVKSIQLHKEKIDTIIKKYSDNWKPERISLVDLNIMRLAVFEILFCDDTPDKAALNEALELAKQFGEEKSVLFINGVLNQVLKNKNTNL